VNEKEKEAREICAFCNFTKSCEECTHREWPTGKWYKKAQFDYSKCEAWREYLKDPITSIPRRFLCWLGAHKWIILVEIKHPLKIFRKCLYCKATDEVKKDEDRTLWYYTYLYGRLA